MFAYDFVARLARAGGALYRERRWQLVAFALFCLSGYNLVARVWMTRDVEQVRGQAAAMIDKWRAQQSAVASVVGRRLAWPGAPAPEEASPRYRVFASLNGLECSLPRTDVTALLTSLQFGRTAKWTPETSLQVFVFDPDQLVPASFRSSHNYTFPVHWDPDHRFATANRLPFEPIVLVVDRDNNIVSAGSPVGHGAGVWTAVSEAIRRMVSAVEGDGTK